MELGEIRSEGAGLYHIRGGKVTKAVHYFDHLRALRGSLVPPADEPRPATK
jgi:hypothetical protein